MNFGSSGDEPLLFFCIHNAKIALNPIVNPTPTPKRLDFDDFRCIFAPSNEKSANLWHITN
jgi:hypothetical protein